MNLSFTTSKEQQPGAVAYLLKRSYAALLADDPALWEAEQAEWARYDQEVFAQAETVGACIFFSRLYGRIVGFGSWDPRPGPRYGIVGHNCILPEFKGKGYGKQQLQEIIRRLQVKEIQTARVSTLNHPFFTPARKMYLTCGFREVRRVPWERNAKHILTEYEKVISP